MLKPAGLMALATAALLALAPAAARGDGLPVVGLDTTRAGVDSLDRSVSYYAVPRRGRTDLLRVEPARDRSLKTLSLDGRLAVPGVAWDGSTGGLAADGSRIVLIEPRRGFPRDRTRMVVVNAARWRLAAEIELRGDFSFDAISPDGSTIYLIHYLHPRRPTEYEVRAYDVESKRLLPEPVIDERTAPATMSGFPMTRATGPAGVWEHTLYSGDSKVFVHALNTVEGTAFCIDLPIGRRGVSAAELAASADGATVTVSRRGTPVAAIDTRDWTATKLNAAAGPDAAAGTDAGGPGALRWIGAGLGILGLAALLFAQPLRALRRRRRKAMPADPLPDLGPEAASRRREDANVERAAR